MPAAEMETARKEFRAWIIGNGLRELEQHFAIYLDHLYQACLLFSSHGSTLPDDHAGRLKQMQDITSIAGKLRRLAEDFSVSARHAAHFASLSTARNVIAHALGIVRQRDCTGQTALRVSWLGRDFVLAGRTLNGGFEPFRVEEESWLQMKVVERERLFQVGTKVTFSSDDLLEICLMFTDEARALAVAIEDFARSKGVVVNPQASGPLS